MKILIAMTLLMSFRTFNPTPRFIHPKGDYSEEYIESAKLIAEHANSDEFYKFFKEGGRTYVSHTDLTLDQAITKFRAQLAQADYIQIEVAPMKGDYIGGWTGSLIRMNDHVNQNDMQAAGTLLHEISHKYGWMHKGNDWTKFDNAHSFPYLVGFNFQAYLEKLERNKKK